MDVKDTKQSEGEGTRVLDDKQLDGVAGGYGGTDTCPNCGSRNIITLLPSRKQRCESCGHQF